MTRDQNPTAEHAPAAPRREYIPPKLERLGTIRDLTQGLGMNGSNDSEHPPGQNKSLI
jgi:hypothetical protein